MFELRNVLNFFFLRYFYFRIHIWVSQGVWGCVSFRTLMNVVIADLIRTNMVQWTSTMTSHVTMMDVQEKTCSYVERTLGNDIIPLAIEMYECFFLFWFIFYHLCIDHYHMSSSVFFSPLDVCFLLSIAHVHSPTTCVNHNDSLASYCTWSGFFISSTHHT
jgi:hypothetical protein